MSLPLDEVPNLLLRCAPSREKLLYGSLARLCKHFFEKSFLTPKIFAQHPRQGSLSEAASARPNQSSLSEVASARPGPTQPV